MLLGRCDGLCYEVRPTMPKKAAKNKPQPTRSEWAAVRGSQIHGRGMFAKKTIPKGTRVIEYTGERITKAEGWRRELARQERAGRGADGCIYIFELNTKVDIDGSVRWNTARYINHSCEPNCESQVVLLDFWATWCPPCVEEVPELVATYEKFRGQGFEIVGISLDENKAAFEKFTTENKMTWPQFFDGKGWENELAKRFGIQTVPTMWLLDREGKLVDASPRGRLEEAVSAALAAKD